MVIRMRTLKDSCDLLYLDDQLAKSCAKLDEYDDGFLKNVQKEFK
jgi:hypothetical protein